MSRPTTMCRPTSSRSAASCLAVPGDARASSGKVNGANVATIATADAVTDLVVATAGPRLR